MRLFLSATLLVLGIGLSQRHFPRAAAQPPAASESNQTATEADQTPPDLTKLAIMEGALVSQQSVARLRYDVASSVRDAFQFQAQQLTKLGWKELEGSYESDASCYGTFERRGYKLSASTYLAGPDGKSSVTLMQHGNVDLRHLPVPEDMTLFFTGPVSASYLTTVPVKAAQAACRELLIQDGWKPYGVAGDSLMFRKKTTLLNAFISAAPAQGGKTMAQFSCELLGAEIPLFPGSVDAHYSDTTSQLSFDSGKSMDDVVDFYKQALTEMGWKPTTDSLVKVSIYDVMIFRNASGDMMRLRLHNFDGQARGLLKFSTAAQVAELEAEAEKKLAEKRIKETSPPRDAELLSIDIPENAKEVEIKPDSIQFQLAPGQARKIVEGWRSEYIQSGWKEQTAVFQDVAGTAVLTLGSKTLTIVYTDIGFMPAEVTIDSTGIQLRRAKR